MRDPLWTPLENGWDSFDPIHALRVNIVEVKSSVARKLCLPRNIDCRHRLCCDRGDRIEHVVKETTKTQHLGAAAVIPTPSAVAVKWRITWSWPVPLTSMAFAHSLAAGAKHLEIHP